MRSDMSAVRGQSLRRSNSEARDAA